MAGSFPPVRAAMVIKRPSLLKAADRFESAMPFCRLIVDHFE